MGRFRATRPVEVTVTSNGFTLGLVLLALLTTLAWIVLRAGRLRHEQTCRFACPHDRGPVDCVLVQDVRTGQWKELRRCSALPPGAPPCDVECARLMNLGFRLQQA